MVTSLEDALADQKKFKQIMDAYLKKGEDYGEIPGIKKPTLLKPGAEKICFLFGLTEDYILENRTVDWASGLFDYEFRCILYDGEREAGQGFGSCSSYETKYRYRDATRKCPQCGVAAIIKGKAEYAQKDGLGPAYAQGGWLCHAKRGGCGKKFPDMAPEIVQQAQGKIINEDPADQKNTIIKIAKKRSKVDAALSATRSSGYFTQDVEDFRDEGPEFHQAEHEPGTNSAQQDLKNAKPGDPNKGHGKGDTVKRPTEAAAPKPQPKPEPKSDPSDPAKHLCIDCLPVHHPRSQHEGENGFGACMVAACRCTAFNDVPQAPVMGERVEKVEGKKDKRVYECQGRVVEFRNTNQQGEKLKTARGSHFVAIRIHGLPPDVHRHPHDVFQCYHQQQHNLLSMSLGEVIEFDYSLTVDQGAPDKNGKPTKPKNVGIVWQSIERVHRVGQLRFIYDEAGKPTIKPDEQKQEDPPIAAEDENQDPDAMADRQLAQDEAHYNAMCAVYKLDPHATHEGLPRYEVGSGGEIFDRQTGEVYDVPTKPH